jgi:hypothetical protein
MGAGIQAGEHHCHLDQVLDVVVVPQSIRVDQGAEHHCLGWAWRSREVVTVPLAPWASCQDVVGSLDLNLEQQWVQAYSPGQEAVVAAAAAAAS